MNFKEEYTDRVEKIEKILKKYLPEKKGYQRTIMEAMEYSLMAGGKRLRPMLMWESYRLFGGEGAAIEPFMAAIEMIHTYSLVHDDLPAMDNDEYRRGRKTTHIVYGEDAGIRKSCIRRSTGLYLQAEDQCIDRGFYDGRCSSCRCRGRAGQQDGADRRKDRAGIPDPG